MATKGIKWTDRHGILYTAIFCLTESGKRIVELYEGAKLSVVSDLEGQDVSPDENWDEVEPTSQDVAAIAQWEGVLA